MYEPQSPCQRGFWAVKYFVTIKCALGSTEWTYRQSYNKVIAFLKWYIIVIYNSFFVVSWIVEFALKSLCFVSMSKWNIHSSVNFAWLGPWVTWHLKNSRAAAFLPLRLRLSSRNTTMLCNPRNSHYIWRNFGGGSGDKSTSWLFSLLCS